MSDLVLGSAAVANRVLAAGTLGSEAGTLALLVIVVLGVVTVLLIRNMAKRLKRLPATFDRPEDGEPPVPGAPPASPVPGPRKR